MSTIDAGKKGEDVAISFLSKKGYRIIERNFKKQHGDIDIVALDDDTLVFVEVKTRYSRNFGPPLEAIPPWRVRELMKSAYLYKLLHPDLPESLRIDALGVDYTESSTKPKIELVKNITL